jgi:PDZ domain-containing protein
MLTSSPPPEAVLPGGPDSGGTAPRRRRRIVTVLVAVAIVGVVVFIAGSVIRLPYYTISPGSALDLNSRITIEGAETFATDDEIMLLFVRERARVNVWRWIQASLDPDIDLFREQQFTGGLDPEEVRVESDADMARSQIAAKKLALEAAGFTVPVGQGVEVLAVSPSRPASDILEPGDVITAVDGEPIVEADDLSERVRAREPGESIEVVLTRDGEEMTVTVPTEAAEDGSPIIGVYVSGVYDFPIDVEVDTSAIGGPSAGLAMTLSILDTLTPGDLTGGMRVAVTGTIAEDGSVGEIGGIEQKTISAKAAGADVFIVPACTREEIKAACEQDLQDAVDRAGDL